MNFNDISRKFSAFGRKMKGSVKSPEAQLEEMEELYNSAIESTDEMIKWLNYYKKDPENPENSFDDGILPEYRLTSLNNAVDDSPKMVSRYYREYRSEVPLLTGEEQRFTASYDTEWSKFKGRIDKHLDFVKEMRKEFKEGLELVEEAQEDLDREKYKKEAEEQRGNQYTIDDNKVMPDRKVEDIEKTVDEILTDRLEDEIEEDEENKDEKANDGDISLMRPRQYVHYIIEYLKISMGKSQEGSEYYNILKDGFPEQAEVIERNIHSLRHLDTVDFEKEGLRSLGDREKQYIKDRVRGDENPKETLEEFKDDYREKELEV